MMRSSLNWVCWISFEEIKAVWNSRAEMLDGWMGWDWISLNRLTTRSPFGDNKFYVTTPEHHLQGHIQRLAEVF